MLVREYGYEIKEIKHFPIAATEIAIDLKGDTAFLHNTTDGKMFYSLVTNAAEDDMWEIASDDVHGPLAFGTLYLKAQQAGNLKVMILEDA